MGSGSVADNPLDFDSDVSRSESYDAWYGWNQSGPYYQTQLDYRIELDAGRRGEVAAARLRLLVEASESQRARRRQEWILQGDFKSRSSNAASTAKIDDTSVMAPLATRWLQLVVGILALWSTAVMAFPSAGPLLGSSALVALGVTIHVDRLGRKTSFMDIRAGTLMILIGSLTGLLGILLLVF